MMLDLTHVLGFVSQIGDAQPIPIPAVDCTPVYYYYDYVDCTPVYYYYDYVDCTPVYYYYDYVDCTPVYYYYDYVDFTCFV